MPVHISNATNAGISALEAAKKLTKASSAADVRAVLKMAAQSQLDPLSQSEIVNVLVEKTAFGKSTIRKALKQLEEDAHLKVPDNASLLGDNVLETEYGGQLRASPDGRFWRYDTRRWVEEPENVVRKRLQTTFRLSPLIYGGGKVSVTVNAALAGLRDRVGVAADPMAISLDPPNVMNLTNGELWLLEPQPELRPHAPDSGLVQLLPIALDPKADCPMFKSAVGEIFGNANGADDMVRHLMEIIGYALQSRRDLPRIIVFHGGGANGKSSVLRVLSALVGPDQVYAGSAANLGRDSFAAANLAGRLLFIDDDLRTDVKLDDGALKSMSEAKLVSARRPYGRATFTYRCLAMPILATNNVPRVSDASHGFERRLLVVPFGRRFTKHEIKPALFDEIVATELPGILNLALEGLQRLRKRGDFLEPADCLIAKKTFLAQANPLRGFVEARLQDSGGAKTPLVDIYAALLEWCTQNGITKPFARNCLKSRLEGMGLAVGKSNGKACLKDRAISVEDLAL